MLWLKIVQSVIKFSVEQALSYTAGNARGKDALHRSQHPAKSQIQGQPIVCHSVHNPGSPSSAQVKLEKEDVVIRLYAGMLQIFNNLILITCKM